MYEGMVLKQFRSLLLSWERGAPFENSLHDSPSFGIDLLPSGRERKKTSFEWRSQKAVNAWKEKKSWECWVENCHGVLDEHLNCITLCITLQQVIDIRIRPNIKSPLSLLISAIFSHAPIKKLFQFWQKSFGSNVMEDYLNMRMHAWSEIFFILQLNIFEPSLSIKQCAMRLDTRRSSWNYGKEFEETLSVFRNA